MTVPGRVRAIVGPTGAGKSARAMQAASDGQAEIVAVDAFTVYRGMDLGTAKPPAPDRAAVAHHMLDVLDPDVDVTVAWFQRRARAAIADIHARGRTALLVGGSGLYFRAVVDDLRFPPTDPAVRARLETRWAHDPPAAHRHLAGLDPDAAARIDPANLRRTVRALEVHELTGEPFSAYRRAWTSYRSIYADLEVTCLDPPTVELRAAITARARAMVAGGLVDEARRLLAAHPDGLSVTAAQAIGYREAFAVVDGDADADGLAPAIATRTWQYARRQRSWFRRDPRTHARSADDGAGHQ